MASISDLYNWFSTVRNEYSNKQGLSVYGNFVAPLDIDSCDLAEANTSVVLVGGRGTGKTIFLRFFSHWTQFDPKRSDIVLKDLENIILYWKPETAFCRAIKPEIYGEDQSKIIFLKLATLEIVKEFIESIRNVGNHFPEASSRVFSDKSFWRAVSIVLSSNVLNEKEFNECIDLALYNAQTNFKEVSLNTSSTPNPKAALELLRKKIIEVAPDYFLNTTFKIFVDEFENLSEYQQKLINDYRKHSDSQQIWNVAHKEFAEVTNQTSGEEQLQERDDYTTFSLLNGLNEKEYSVFSGEILLNTLIQKGGLYCGIPEFNHIFLSDKKSLSHRRLDSYQESILSEVKRIFPSLSLDEMCYIACQNKVVSKKIYTNLTAAGISSSLAFKLLETYPSVAVAYNVIVFQKSFLKNKNKQIDALEDLGSNSVSKDSPLWTKVRTYAFTSLYALNMDNSYINIPIYSGYERFSFLSAHSIRNLISLVFQTIKIRKIEGDASFERIDEIPPFTALQMHNAAILVSEQLLKETLKFTPFGVRLSSFTNRLGQYFRGFYKIPSQPEPEVSHFFIDGDYGDLSDDLKKFIEVAKTWKILIEDNPTKEKSSSSSSAKEYRLNPVYAPAFGISYRKIRRKKLTLNDFSIFYEGTNEEYDALLKERTDPRKQTNEDDEQEQLDLLVL